MRRPLAVFGFSLLIAMLIVSRLSVGLFWVVVAIIAAAIVVFVLYYKKHKGYGVLVAVAVLVAFSAHGVYNMVVVAPIKALAGIETTVSARVTEIEPGYGEDTVHATLKVLKTENMPYSFKVKVENVPKVEVGYIIDVKLHFDDFSTASELAYQYANGFFVKAQATGEIQVGEYSPTLLDNLREVQYMATESIQSHLPQRLSSVAAAMTVGDDRFLSWETKDVYRRAGLSHMLVLSGFHLSLLCSMIQMVFGRMIHNRRIMSLITIVFVCVFMLFVGMTPSIVRSGIMWILMLVANLGERKSDAFTSMGFAAVLLVLQNPYAATDVGLLLSFSATIGTLIGGKIAKAQQLKWMDTVAKWPKKCLRYVLALFMVPICATLAILPVQIYAGMGMSVFSVPMNVLFVPFLPIIVLCGFCMAIPQSIPLLGIPGILAAPIGGGLLSLLELVSTWCAQYQGVYIVMEGLYPLVVNLAIYAMMFWSVKAGKRVVGVFASVAVLVLSVSLHVFLSYNTVKMVVAGTGDNSSLVVMQNGKAAVLYRNYYSLNDISQVLSENRIEECVLLIDLRSTVENISYQSVLNPQNIVFAQEDIVSGKLYYPFDDEVSITVQRQETGVVACVDVEGYKVGMYTGSMDLTYFAPLDVLISGRGQIEGEYDKLLCGGAVPSWANENTQILHSDGSAEIWLRKGKSVRYKEVAYAT